MANLPTGGVPKVTGIIWRNSSGQDTPITVNTASTWTSVTVNPDHRYVGIYRKTIEQKLCYVLINAHNNTAAPITNDICVMTPKPSMGYPTNFPVRYFIVDDINNKSDQYIRFVDADNKLLYADYGYHGKRNLLDDTELATYAQVIPADVLDFSDFFPENS